MIYSFHLGEKRYELSNHLGNVLSFISDRRTAFESATAGIAAYYEPEVISAQDYDPFGMLLVGRTFGENYRFGFNTQEQDNEVYGNGNLNTALFWEYDSRLGRRWNPDPKPVHSNSPYSCFLNSPIIVVDKLGDTTFVINAQTGTVLSFIADNLYNNDFVIKLSQTWKSIVHCPKSHSLLEKFAFLIR